MPRAMMSVATSTSILPSRKPLERAVALLLRAVGVHDADVEAVVLEDRLDQVGAALGPGEDEHAVGARAGG